MAFMKSCLLGSNFVNHIQYLFISRFIKSNSWMVEECKTSVGVANYLSAVCDLRNECC